MDLYLGGGVWIGQALRVLTGWAFHCIRVRKLLPFDSEQQSSMAGVAALGAAGAFTSPWLEQLQNIPEKHRLLIGIALGFMSQVWLRDATKATGELKPPGAQ